MTDFTDTAANAATRIAADTWAQRDLITLDVIEPAGDGRGTISRRRVVNMAESPLVWLHHRGYVSARQFAAGQQLQLWYERASLEPGVTMRWDRAGGGGGGYGASDYLPAERQLAARAAFHRAMDSLGPGLGDIVWRVICAGEGMTHAERELSWPARSGRLVLTLALDRLADHFRIGRA